MPTAKGASLNCFALLNRTNNLLFKTTTQKITSSFISEQLERLSFSIHKITVLVLDNARVHTSQKIQERRPFWQKCGLHVFYLPPYSRLRAWPGRPEAFTWPHLNLAETSWRKLKYEWLQPADYNSSDTLFYTVRQALSAVGSSLTIYFSNFALG